MRLGLGPPGGRPARCWHRWASRLAWPHMWRCPASPHRTRQRSSPNSTRLARICRWSPPAWTPPSRRFRCRITRPQPSPVSRRSNGSVSSTPRQRRCRSSRTGCAPKPTATRWPSPSCGPAHSTPSEQASPKVMASTRTTSTCPSPCSARTPPTGSASTSPATASSSTTHGTASSAS